MLLIVKLTNTNQHDQLYIKNIICVTIFTIHVRIVSSMVTTVSMYSLIITHDSWMPRIATVILMILDIVVFNYKLWLNDPNTPTINTQLQVQVQ